jgi:hypothetical protein
VLSRICEENDDKPTSNDDNLANGNVNADLWNKNDLPQQLSVSTQTNFIDRLAAAVINDMSSVD